MKQTYLRKKIETLKQDVIKMGTQVKAELNLAIEALTQNNQSLANRVFSQDDEVNARRHQIEEKVLILLATQQPTAVDLRDLVSMFSITTDLERMGDQAKNIAKAIPFVLGEPTLPLVDELKKMAEAGSLMLERSLIAYEENDIDLAKEVAEYDDEVDKIFANLYAEVIVQLEGGESTYDTQVGFEILRVAQAIERFGDLATNIAERVIYRVTSRFTELNIDYEAIS